MTASGARLDNVVSTTPGKGTASVSLSLDINGTVCSWAGNGVPFTYALGASKIVFTNAPGLKGGACGSASLNATFDLSIASVPVILN